jgi:putative selenium metabolism hydrolase
MFDFLRRLVQTRGIATEEGDVAELIVAELHKLGIANAHIDSTGNVLATLGSDDGPILALNGHMDTVRVTKAAWERDPFAAEVEDGILYGVGAGDMKGSLAAMTYAAARLQQTGLPLNGRLMLTYTVQEETCEGLGMRYLVEESGLQPDWVIVCEPTDMQISRGQRGRVMLKITTHGKSSHAARPDLGVNAVNTAARLIFGIDLLSADLHSDPFLGPGTAAVTHIECLSPSRNAVPDQCTFYVDRRLTLGETIDMAVGEVERVIATEGVKADVEVFEYTATSYTGKVCTEREAFNAWAMEPDHEFVTTLGGTVRQALGYAPQLMHWNFSTDAVYTIGDANIPTLGFGPGDPDLAHTVHDQVRLDDIASAAHVYAALTAKLLGD